VAEYHCYILRPDRSISSRHDIEAADDAEAMVKASQVVALSDEVRDRDRESRGLVSVRKVIGCCDPYDACTQQHGYARHDPSVRGFPPLELGILG
jgi:hypothetical protein